jgi:NAD(P)-dependent dehydrogenase (short-subunit alcohol dehydrogenase family)
LLRKTNNHLKLGRVDYSSFGLLDKIAVVTGASQGIGRAIALGLAQAGAHLVLAKYPEKRQDEIRAVQTEIEALGRRAIIVQTDVAEVDQVRALMDKTKETFGRIDILVNAAGYTFKQATVEVSEAQWSALFDTNLNGALRACQSFYEPLKSSGRGRIINIASLSSFLAFREVAAYSASKTALLSLTRSLACEWARDGISVNAIIPGVFPTEMNSALIMGSPRGQELLMRTPMGRFGKAEELVGAAVLLASDGAAFITGQSIAVDGGYLASGVNS